MQPKSPRLIKEQTLCFNYISRPKKEKPHKDQQPTAMASSTKGTILPSKPHFFQPLLPGFLSNFLIPRAFMMKCLSCAENQCMDGVLRSRSGRLWQVKINGRQLVEGWPEFARQHNLHVGDFVVFKHEGDLVFHVTALEPSGCERPCLLFGPNQVKGKDGHQHHPRTMPEEISDVTVKPEENVNSRLPGAKGAKSEQAMTSEGETSSDIRHSLVSTIRPYNLEHSYFYIPVHFARANGLCNKNGKMILRDQNGGLWPVALMHRRNNPCSVYIGHGWMQFAQDNNLNLGEKIIIECANGGEEIVMNFFRKLSP